MPTSKVLLRKTLRFLENHGVFARRRGVEAVCTFCGQGGGGQFLTILCGRLLQTAPYLLNYLIGFIFSITETNILLC